MPKPVDVYLTEADRQQLQAMLRRNLAVRTYQRVRVVLLLGQRLSCAEVAAQVQWDVRTVGRTRARWIEQGFASLEDMPRCGAPCKLDEASVQRLVQWAKDEPLSMPQLLQRHEQAGGVKVGRTTAARTLKRQGLGSKRTRHSLKKSETPPPLNAPPQT